MFKFMRRALATVLTAALVLSTPVSAATSPSTAPAPAEQSSVKADKTDGITTTVSTSTDGTATIKSIAKTKKKSITVPSKVTVNGVTYEVTALGAKAFKNCTKATKVTVPASIKKIQKNAFNGSKVNTIVLKTKKSITVEKGAFKGRDTSKMTIKVNKKISKKEFKKLKKVLKAAGFKGKIKKA
ncbi:MAG: hypothetical protein E7302_07505 [Butyrivibrio sp.]|jgi:hypothetical protein|nr:hypothetical protein [Butyrivibrio sp.]